MGVAVPLGATAFPVLEAPAPDDADGAPLAPAGVKGAVTPNLKVTCKLQDDIERSKHVPRFIGGGDSGGKVGKRLSGRCGRVDGTIHASFAVRLASAEEPDGAGGLGDLQSEDTNLAASCAEGHERRSEAVLLGDGVELLCARV